MNQKENILEYLAKEYTVAKEMNDAETMIRLTRAIIAFSYNNFETEEISWNNMVDAYMF